jgi:hypothetical protein
MLADAGLTGCTLEIMLVGGFKVVTIGRLVRHGTGAGRRQADRGDARSHHGSRPAAVSD